MFELVLTIQIVSNKIIEQLEEGVIPWKKPWVGQKGPAVNWKTQKAYRGINTLLLEPGEYLTFKQVKEAGGRVIKGARSHIVVFCKCSFELKFDYK
ncbi:ArdC-like ssDNA-binding domain-containing protein [Massilibacterium senegalense]|uniref:ArdC-like ssDNA-binding domain-containing protein n=1 Tax=Massilibacterium senegalense TaxID=1632858 RepID=UPI0007809172|nr:ArdC family protein [Massilibacterium senegalense]